jgi:hypothetical protein
MRLGRNLSRSVSRSRRVSSFIVDRPAPSDSSESARLAVLHNLAPIALRQGTVSCFILWLSEAMGPESAAMHRAVPISC